MKPDEAYIVVSVLVVDDANTFYSNGTAYPEEDEISLTPGYFST